MYSIISYKHTIIKAADRKDYQTSESEDYSSKTRCEILNNYQILDCYSGDIKKEMREDKSEEKKIQKLF